MDTLIAKSPGITGKKATRGHNTHTCIIPSLISRSADSDNNYSGATGNGMHNEVSMSVDNYTDV